MPRLLLVDDNQSIHKIAETLLASTDVELVCVDSAEKALDLISKGERFDVALLDTVMTGMDGWQLLDKLRQDPHTQRIPIALMAGVLDVVDPKRLSEAPIQGFIKKPVELRDLGDRVRRLLEIPVPLAELPPEAPEQKTAAQTNELSPFATIPGTHPGMGGMSFQAESYPGEVTEAHTTIGEPVEMKKIVAPIASAELENDLLLLTEEDLFPIEAPVTAPAPKIEEPVTEQEAPLHLEELDMESLKQMVIEPPLETGTSPSLLLPTPEQPKAAEWGVDTGELPDLDSDLRQPVELRETVQQSPSAMVPKQELAAESVQEEWFAPPPPPPEAPIQEPEMDEEDLDLTPLPAYEAKEPAFTETLQKPETKDFIIPESVHVMPTIETPVAPAVAPVPKIEKEAPMVAPMAVTAALDSSSLNRQAIVDAILSDPVLIDALAKAVVARLGEQSLLEVAWEVMPELAERMGRTAGL